jgi:hypothetical protein
MIPGPQNYGTAIYVTAYFSFLDIEKARGKFADGINFQCTTNLNKTWFYIRICRNKNILLKIDCGIKQQMYVNSFFLFESNNDIKSQSALIDGHINTSYLT